MRRIYCPLAHYSIGRSRSHVLQRSISLVAPVNHRTSKPWYGGGLFNEGEAELRESEVEGNSASASDVVDAAE